MKQVYLLHHVRRDDEYAEDAKMIGAYRSKEAANAAIVRLSSQPGFSDYPKGFQVEAYTLDEDHWTEGFVDLSHLHEDSSERSE